MSSSKMSKRFERLIKCVKSNDVQRLEYYLRRKKYKKMHIDESAVNKRGETLLHVACRLCKYDIVTFLLKESLGDPTAIDLKGNTGLHLALKSIMKIDERCEYLTAYRRMVLHHLKEMSASLSQPNFQGQTVKDLLDLADSVYQYHLGGSEQEKIKEAQLKDEMEWQTKLTAELDDEYGSSWGKYENDFIQEVDEAETYDSWAERMLFEHRKRLKSQTYAPRPTLQPETKPAWSEEDQKRFLEEEESRKLTVKALEISNKRFAFLSKLNSMLKSDGKINSSDLPFCIADDIEDICQLILFHVKELEGAEAKRKALRELQRLWHPDKFSQKFGSRLSDEIRDGSLRKVTEISQYLNAFNCDSSN